jgi:hypothetical protein
MTRIDLNRNRQSLLDIASRVAADGESVVLAQSGKDLAAVVPMALYRWVEAEEDRRDVAAARHAEREAAARGEKPISIEELRRRIGLAAAPRRRKRK